MKPVEFPALAESKLRPLLALLQLASPALPVGGFAYSQGLEKAIDDGIVSDTARARIWIEDLLLLAVARTEAPLWLRVFDSATANDQPGVVAWNAELLAMRETAELRAETLQMGASVVRVFDAMRLDVPRIERMTYPAGFAIACAALGADRRDGLTAYLWQWVEAQVLVAVKVVPLGQQAGQTLLFDLHGSLTRAVALADSLQDAEIGGAPIGFALTSARHERQYSRLYRS